MSWPPDKPLARKYMLRPQIEAGLRGDPAKGIRPGLNIGKEGRFTPATEAERKQFDIWSFFEDHRARPSKGVQVVLGWFASLEVGSDKQPVKLDVLSPDAQRRRGSFGLVMSEVWVAPWTLMSEAEAWHYNTTLDDPHGAWLNKPAEKAWEDAKAFEEFSQRHIDSHRS